MATPKYMVWTWAGWEPLQYYRRFGGFHEQQEGDALWQQEWKQEISSAATAAALAEAGINWVTTHFFKGFGLHAEGEEIRQTVELIGNFHSAGIKVFAYIQYGTIMPETLLAEEPGAAAWPRVDWNGHHDGPPYEYGTQYWRLKPCANQPGFLDYLKHCIDGAIEIGADGVWFDNVNADGCHCDKCQEAFQRFLHRTAKDPWKEFGLTDISRTIIPRVQLPRDPLFRAWLRCRTDEVRASMQMLTHHARQRKADVVVAANFGFLDRGLADNALWIGDFGDVDFLYAENHLFPVWEKQKIVSQQHSMKLAAGIGVGVVPGALPPQRRVGPYAKPALPDERQLRRVFAESAMFGSSASNGPWGLRGEDGDGKPVYLHDAGFRHNTRRLADFYRLQFESLRGSEDLSSVALLYSFEAMAFDQSDSQRAFDAMSQLLMTNQIPFRYCLSDRANEIKAEVQLVILPHVLPVSDELASQLLAFVRRGGKILATGRSSFYDEEFRQRKDYALSEILGVHFSNDFELKNQHSVAANPANGCVLLPGEWGLVDEHNRPYCQVSDPTLASAIRKSVEGESSVKVVSPVPHVQVASRRLRDVSSLLSFLNYGDDPVAGIYIELNETTFENMKDLKANDAQGASFPVEARRRADGKMNLMLPALDVELFVNLAQHAARRDWSNASEGNPLAAR